MTRATPAQREKYAIGYFSIPCPRYFHTGLDQLVYLGGRYVAKELSSIFILYALQF